MLYLRRNHFHLDTREILRQRLATGRLAPLMFFHRLRLSRRWRLLAYQRRQEGERELLGVTAADESLPLLSQRTGFEFALGLGRPACIRRVRPQEPRGAAPVH